MTHYIRDGNRFQVAPAGAMDIAEILPLGTYKVGYVEPFDKFYLEQIDDFETGGKIYGDTIAQRDRILRTFEDRDSATGVLLSGEKGSGKTLLATLVALEAQEKGIPTLVINQPWAGDTFNAFMQSIEQPTVVVFDEFEKVYSNETQEKLLTLLDGTYASKKLFLLTCNDKYKVNSHMKNRPGRLYYRFDFGGLDAEFIRAYCEDNLANKDRIDEVARASLLFARFNFDILKAVVQEMNRYDESVEDVLKVLNAKPEMGENHKYSVALYEGEKQIPTNRMHNRGIWRGNPLTDRVDLYYSSPKAAAPTEINIMLAPDPYIDDDDDENSASKSVEFYPSDLKRVDMVTGAFNYENAHGLRAVLEEQIREIPNYSVVF